MFFAGLELTFANDYTKASFKEGNPTIEHQKIQEFMEGLRDQIEENLKPLIESAYNAKVSIEFVEDIQKDFGGKSGQVSNLRVTISDVHPDAPEHLQTLAKDWGFTISLDPQVIEVQMGPASWDPETANWESEIVQATYDFVLSNEDGLFSASQSPFNGLAPNPTLGGGHVNIDAETAGFESSDQIVELLQRWEDHRAEAAHDEDSLIEQNPQCQAVLSVTRYKGLFDGKKGNAHAHDIRAALDDARGQKWEQAMAIIEKAFFDHPQRSIINDAPGCLPEAEIPRNAKARREEASRIVRHNQAVNVEHLESSGPTGRIEFREFRAQNSPAEVNKSIALCYGLVSKVTASSSRSERGSVRYNNKAKMSGGNQRRSAPRSVSSPTRSRGTKSGR
ncbi:MAG: hypothetical protein HOW73_18310 [Polyangiaceae bacterium]|nr:hypothetical protein [Polyangiaceae bacterium]